MKKMRKHLLFPNFYRPDSLSVISPYFCRFSLFVVYLSFLSIHIFSFISLIFLTDQYSNSHQPIKQNIGISGQDYPSSASKSTSRSLVKRSTHGFCLPFEWILWFFYNMYWWLYRLVRSTQQPATLVH